MREMPLTDLRSVFKVCKKKIERLKDWVHGGDIAETHVLHVKHSPLFHIPIKVDADTQTAGF